MHERWYWIVLGVVGHAVSSHVITTARAFEIEAWLGLSRRIASPDAARCVAALEDLRLQAAPAGELHGRASAAIETIQREAS